MHVLPILFPPLSLYSNFFNSKKNPYSHPLCIHFYSLYTRDPRAFQLMPPRVVLTLERFLIDFRTPEPLPLEYFSHN